MPAAAHIFTTADQIIEHYPFLPTIKYEKLLPSIKFVERRYIPELMDDTTFAGLLTQMGEASPAEPWAKLIELVRDASAYLVAKHYIPHGNVQIGQNGLMVDMAEGQAPASRDRKNDLIRGITTQAIDTLDLVIAHLEANVDTFTAYASSEIRTKQNASLIRTATDFNERYNIGTNRWVWRMLRPWRDKAERSRIIGTIGQDYYDELITQRNAGTLTPENKVIFTKAADALAYATMQHSIMNLSLTIDETGVTVYNNPSQPTDEMRTTAEIKRIELAATRCQHECDRLLEEIEKELDANASAEKYATYFASDKYTAPADAVNLNDPTEQSFFNAL